MTHLYMSSLQRLREVSQKWDVTFLIRVTWLIYIGHAFNDSVLSHRNGTWLFKYVLRDSFIQVKFSTSSWCLTETGRDFSDTCDMTHLYRSHFQWLREVSQKWDVTSVCVTWLIYMCQAFNYFFLLLRPDYLNMCDMTHLYRPSLQWLRSWSDHQ